MAAPRPVSRHNISSVMHDDGMAMRRFQMLLDDALEPLAPVRADPLWELVGVDDTDDDPGGTVDIDEVVYGGRR